LGNEESATGAEDGKRSISTLKSGELRKRVPLEAPRAYREGPERKAF